MVLALRRVIQQGWGRGKQERSTQAPDFRRWVSHAVVFQGVAGSQWILFRMGHVYSVEFLGLTNGDNRREQEKP